MQASLFSTNSKGHRPFNLNENYVLVCLKNAVASLSQGCFKITLSRNVWLEENRECFQMHCPRYGFWGELHKARIFFGRKKGIPQNLVAARGNFFYQIRTCGQTFPPNFARGAILHPALILEMVKILLNIAPGKNDIYRRAILWVHPMQCLSGSKYYDDCSSAVNVDDDMFTITIILWRRWELPLFIWWQTINNAHLERSHCGCSQ